MTRMRFYIHLLCLVTFTWAATCVGETLIVYQYAQDDSHSQTTLVEGTDQSWVFHHIGHQDQHETATQDEECANEGQMHEDHIVKHGCVNGIVAKVVEPSLPAKAPAMLLAEPPQSTPLHTVATLIPASWVADLAPATRNSSLAIVKLTRMRI